MGSRKLLLLPGLAFTFNIDVLLALQRGESSRNELALLVLPLVLVISAGLASLESSPRVALRRTALATILLISLIYCNNVFLVTALHPPRGPGQSVRELEQDRAAVRVSPLKSSATSPNMLKSVSGMPINAWPNTAPAHPNGIAAMIRNGWKYDLNSIVSSTNIAKLATTKPTPRLRNDSFDCSRCPSQRTRTSG
jgi:hypothetical protein